MYRLIPSKYSVMLGELCTILHVGVLVTTGGGTETKHGT
jgi:hypothetical protein